ncbi:MAG: hypothetical protein JST68_26430 [Bacteroidetes bacterium]|nr:hypothetical protein [Bacteroidota bacterium]
MKALSTLFFLGFFILICTGAGAQGCSDAGFCTIGNLRQLHQAADSSHQRLGLNLAVGVGDEGVFVFTPALRYEYSFDRRWSVEAKLTGNYASGSLGNAAGLGDLFLSGTYVFNPGSEWKWSGTLGGKLPFNRSDLKEDGKPLPMQYQSSLGTFDLIAGVSVNSERWQFSAGYQQPLTGTNRNGFLPVFWMGNADAAKYAATADFKRKPDVLLRGFYQLVNGGRLQLGGGLLGIYHIGRDTYVDANKSAGRISIQGSDGLTLNLTGTVRWVLTNRLVAGITGGAPLVVRDVRPDGLTRSFVLAPEFTWRF